MHKASGGVDRLSKATFVVKIRHRKNATWQGSLTCLESKQTVCFRSMDELLCLMGSVAKAPVQAGRPR